jgi:DUF1680 family protein
LIVNYDDLCDREEMAMSPQAPTARLHAVPLAQTAVRDTFWSAKLDLLRSITIDDVLSKFEQNGAFDNFDRVARRERGTHRGSPWFDGLIYETIRAAADFLCAAPDPRLDARLDASIERIAAAQATDADGYLNTYVMLMCPDQRWGARGGDQLWSHEEYDAGCLIEAAVHHYRATRKTNLLGLAVRFANYMCDYIGPPPKHNVVPSHSLPEEALLKLYRLLRDQPELTARLGAPSAPDAYLDLVRFWIANRGNHHGRTGFTEYAQDHMPVADQDAAVGHAVRATLLYTGLAALANEIGAPEYHRAAARLWEDVTERKLYLTGGVGSINQYEGFSFGYYLPSDGYNETCAAVGLAFWAGHMNEAFGGGEYADVVERVLYNGALAGVSLAGTEYSYQNPLLNRGEVHRWAWHNCPCCPPMLLKLYAGLGELIYAHDRRDIFVNQYIGSTGQIPLEAGEVELTLQSELPWHGAISATLRLPAPRHFGLHFRVPSWCTAMRAQVNRQLQAALGHRRGYVVLERTWHDGDTVQLELEMPIQRMIAHPFVGQLQGRVALRRGPLIYCVEGVDHAGVGEPILAANPQLSAEERPDLLGGVIVLVGRTQDGGVLRAVPYYAWDNRKAPDPSQDWMAVWLKQADAYALRHSLEGDKRSGWEQQLYRALVAELSSNR